ncbi:hypothetical protein CYANOKiyG1_54100 [Okeania sp. KiyG1]|nr:hypothetical protein CYANOKiyG1_54100 [Okeania sp. KiyG1]
MELLQQGVIKNFKVDKNQVEIDISEYFMGNLEYLFGILIYIIENTFSD